MKLNLKRIVALCVLLQVFVSGFAQQDLSAYLTVGDKAPELKYSKWLQGAPVSAFQKDKVYVVEFWATWCGPCIAAMPHLSALSKQYADQITFIGVNVWENIAEGQPYESVAPVLTKFVENQGERLTYNVSVESNDRHMAKQWLEKSLTPGIPVTFVIKAGIIQWIGHPVYIDKILVEVLQPNYDLAKYKQEHQASLARRLKEKEEDVKMQEPITAALDAKDYKTAIHLMEQAGVNRPVWKYRMDMRKFSTLLQHVSEKEAMRFAEDSKQTAYCAPFVLEKEGYAKETYQWAIQILKQGRDDPGTQVLIASAHAKMGDFPTAIAIQKQAIQDGKIAVASGKGGKISAASILEFEQQLKLYEQKLLKNK